LATFIGVGFSQQLDACAAAQEATQQAKRQLNHDRIDLAMVFNTIHYSPSEFLPPLFQELQQTRLIGSSTAGLLTPQRVILRGIGLILLCSDNIKFEAGCVNHLQLQDKATAGKTLIQNTLSDFGVQQRKIFLCLADGLLTEVTDFLAGAQSLLGPDVLMAGGGSSDNFHFQKTYQHFKDKSFTHSAVGVLLGGRMSAGVSVRHGWKPLGKPRFIDQAEGHIIRRISGQKAITPYREYFADRADVLAQEHLGNI